MDLCTLKIDIRGVHSNARTVILQKSQMNRILEELIKEKETLETLFEKL